MSERLDLDRLYTLVPAAEEADLLEGLVAERYHEVYETLLFGERSWPLPPPSPAAEDDDGADPEPPDPLSYAQALGLLEHYLGARPMTESPGTPPGWQNRAHD
ncbi:MAG TPA: hypothetical protein VEZ46_01230 [Mycobacteriales bacterium]|nr:hypothetical protein [Mycobacteriales bacterium]